MIFMIPCGESDISNMSKIISSKYFVCIWLDFTCAKYVAVRILLTIIFFVLCQKYPPILDFLAHPLLFLNIFL